MKKDAIRNLTLSAMFLAIGFVLPFLTGQIQPFGMMLLPMHIPVLLCALICGWKYGLAVGLILPVLRSATLGMPPMIPMAVSMSLEMATYGLILGLMYMFYQKKTSLGFFPVIYLSLIKAMLIGRAVWGIAMFLLLSARGGMFTFQAFIAGAFVNAVPGIILQLVLIPAVMIALDKAGLIKFRK